MYRTIGIVAHVDAGKTTFTEQLLTYVTERFTKGRVDKGTAFLDFHEMERMRGMTIFAEQARFQYDDITYTWIDTPGHLDFSPEMERTLPILDAAVVVVSALDGLTGSTESMIQRLTDLQIPTFFFINKMDASETTTAHWIKILQYQLQRSIVSIAYEETDELIEALAIHDEQLFEQWIEGTLDEETTLAAARTQLQNGTLSFLSTGSALHDEGVFPFFNFIHMWINPSFDVEGTPTGTIFKIRHDEEGRRLAFARLFSGTITLRDTISFRGQLVKVTHLFYAHGQSYVPTERVEAGDIVVFLGLPTPEIGDTIGPSSLTIPSTIPTMQARLVIHDERSIYELWPIFERLNAEDPSLQIQWDAETEQLYCSIMGLIQLETLQGHLERHFQLHVTFGEPDIIYRETVCERTNGYGHFEPLKHYAEVHVAITPNEEGQGVTFEDETHPNMLTSGERAMIRHTVCNEPHYGTLTGAMMTDIHVTLLRAATHPRHTSPGDLREATKRAIRQALERSTLRLLEPMYRLQATVEPHEIGRLMSDIERGAGVAAPPETIGKRLLLRARVPVQTFSNYNARFASYTKGRGQLSLQFDHFAPCHNAEDVISSTRYEIEHDTRTTSASIFCTKGAGFSVKGDDAIERMHLPIIE